MKIRTVSHSNRNVNLSMHVVLTGALAIARYDRDVRNVRGLEVKDDYLDHHSIVTPADYASQEDIIDYLASLRIKLPLNTEEKVEQEKRMGLTILKAEEPRRVMRALKGPEGVLFVDPLCGSSPHEAGIITPKDFIGGSYAVSAAVARLSPNGFEVLGGAVRVPDYKGGALYSGSKTDGSAVILGGKYVKIGSSIVRMGGREIGIEVNQRVTDLKGSLIIFNADTPLWDRYPALYIAQGMIAPKGRTSSMLESCGDSMSRVAAGWAHGMIHAPISPEHWAGGVAIVEGAGGKIIFYEMDEAQRPVRLEGLEPRHLMPSKRVTGFVLGNEEIAEQLMDLLLQAGRRI